jgi:DNA-binding response OmpR family regulator
MTEKHVLLVEDHAQTRQILALVLQKAGYRVTQASDGKRALELLTEQESAHSGYDVVVTDIVMSGFDGVQVARVARQQAEAPEVILLTGHGTLETAMEAIRAGAFDYLLKPCENEQILERVAAAYEHRKQRIRQMRESQMLHTVTEILKSTQEYAEIPESPKPSLGGTSASMTDAPDVQPNESKERYICIGKLCIDTYRHEVWFDTHQLSITPSEYIILDCLASRPGRVVSFGDIVHCTRGYRVDDAEAKELLRQHILNLRKKLDRRYIVSVYGVGYMLVDPAEEERSAT